MSDDVEMNDSRMGEILYRALPEHYRDSDDGTLANYVDICGGLLDRMNESLDSLHEDFLPGKPLEGREPQPWTLPYTASLYGASLCAPDEAGRMEEIRLSIRWNQRKGTLTAVEEIVEQLGNTECIISEGKQKTATAVRVGASAPKTVTPVIGRRMVPKTLENATLRAEMSMLGGKPVLWETDGLGGIPAVQNSFFDQSVRTLDFRKGSLRGGQANPSRIVLHIPPFAGFFPVKQRYIAFQESWLESGYDDVATDDDLNDKSSHSGLLISIQGNGRGQRKTVVIENRSGESLRINGVVLIDKMDVEVRDIVFRDRIEVRGGNLTLERCAVSNVLVTERRSGSPMCIVNDSLVREIQVAKGTVQLEHSTVMKSICCNTLLASDSILAVKTIRRDLDTTASVEGLLRYCTITPGLPEAHVQDLQRESATVREETVQFLETKWRKTGCGVVIRGSSDFVENGAENLGVLGSFNHRFFTRRFKAMKKKVAEYLPLGMDAVVIEDPLLLDKTLFKDNRF